jgi:hypothetical protein
MPGRPGENEAKRLCGEQSSSSLARQGATIRGTALSFESPAHMVILSHAKRAIQLQRGEPLLSLVTSKTAN